MNPYWAATRAWARSLPLVILTPAGAWFAFFLFAWISDGGGELNVYSFMTAFVIFASVFTHLSCYLIAGLPLFMIGYLKEYPWVFNPLICGALGLLFGAAGGMLAAGVSLGVFGAMYGLWTGVFACRFKPKSPREAGDGKPDLVSN